MMEVLKQRILAEGEAYEGGVLIVDQFLNHQIDPILSEQLGNEITRRYEGETITKVLTVEASGIAVALMTARALGVPVVFAKKAKNVSQIGEILTAEVYSFTKKQSTLITVSKKFINESDRVLIVDDFLAHGEALRGLCQIVEITGAQVVGVGIVIEKVFQGGGKKLRSEGLRIESLARIASMGDGKIEFAE
jgi:xanthine phosphoribosyltransferase